jgi:flagellar protein FlbD
MTPDTVITLTNGHQFMVRESGDEVVARIVEFRRSLGAHSLAGRTSEPQPAGGEQE